MATKRTPDEILASFWDKSVGSSTLFICKMCMAMVPGASWQLAFMEGHLDWHEIVIGDALTRSTDDK